MCDYVSEDRADGRQTEPCPSAGPIVEFITGGLPAKSREATRARVLQCRRCLAEMMALRLSVRISRTARKSTRRAKR